MSFSLNLWLWFYYATEKFGKRLHKYIYDQYCGWSKRVLSEEIDAEEAETGGRGHMLLTNLIIEVNGNTATAWVIWTGIANDDLKKPPRFLEQGREYDELVKVDGRWFIQKRYITSDSGLTEMWEETYKPRAFR